jgi:hypothetical protein
MKPTSRARAAQLALEKARNDPERLAKIGESLSKKRLTTPPDDELEAAEDETPPPNRTMTVEPFEYARIIKPDFGEKTRPIGKSLPFDAFDDLDVDVRKPWIMKNVIARRETSSWTGGPKKGKSALVTDLAVSAARGIDWRGYRSKERCAVVYIAFERADLTKRRLEAYKRKYGLHGLPIAIVKAPAINVMTPESVEVLTDTIRSVEQRFRLPVGLVIIDTWAKALALGGGNEDRAMDQNRALGHLRQVEERTDIHIALVNHTGKDESRGTRGSNATEGDFDVLVEISGSTVKTATVTRANDQPEGPLTSYTMESYSFGTDEDGDEISVGIMSQEAQRVQEKAASDDEPNLTRNQRTLFDILHSAGPRGLTTEEWNERAREAGLGIKRKADLYDTRSSLLSKRLIRLLGERWTVAPC